MMSTYIVLAIYFGALFLVGALASKKISSMSDFFVGGKKLGFWVVAFSSRATGESGWLLLGLTGLGAMLGLKAMWAVVGEVIGVALCWFFMAKPFKRFTDTHQSMTIPDYLVSRFQSKTHLLRIVSAFVLTVFVTIYVSAQMDATGSAFETFLGWNYFVGVLVGFAIVLCYIFTGGFVAVAWSDFIQGVIMLLGLVILPFVGYFALPKFGRNDGLLNGLESIDPALVSFWGDGGASLMNTMGIIGFLVIGIGFLGSPQIFVRFMSVKNEDEINKGTWVAILFTLFAGVAAVLAGMIGRLMFTRAGESLVEILGNGGQNVLPMLVEASMPSIVVAIYIVAVLSAIMSTVDSLLVVASSAVTRDIYQKVCFPILKQENMVAMSRKITVMLALVALAISLTVAILSPTRTIFWFVIFGWSGISASFCPMMILSLFWKRYNEKGAIASMVSGFLGVPFFKFVAPNIAVVGPYMDQLSELAPAFALSLVVGVVVTLMTSKEGEVQGAIVQK
jgi:sodium/proline symporter